MNQKSFIEAIDDETLAKMIDKTLKYKKRNKVERVKSNMFKIIPVATAIALVIGAMNLLPVFFENSNMDEPLNTIDTSFTDTNATSNNLDISNSNNGYSYWGSGGAGHTVSLQAKEVITVDIVTESGEISLSITDNKSGESVYSGKNLKTGMFDITMKEAGEYFLYFTVTRYAGNFKFKISDGEWILLSNPPEPPESPEIPEIQPTVPPEAFVSSELQLPELPATATEPPVPPEPEIPISEYNFFRSSTGSNNILTVVLYDETEITAPPTHFGGIEICDGSGELILIGESTIKLPSNTTIKAPVNTVISGSAAKSELKITIGDGNATITQSDGTSSTIPAGTVLDGEGNIIK